ncbi:MAG: SIS domain-containing protein [Bryobacteraceae bacterium]|nr:SIS domain-containing protein [Bryobacteraceae bacterium]
MRRTFQGLDGDRGMLHAADTLRSSRRIVLTGMGSSLYALYPLYLRLLDAGIFVHLVESAELIHYQPKLLAAADAILAVSQSGRSAEIVRLLDQRPAGVPLIAITNDSESPLALNSDITLLLSAGPEVSVSCKTYLASLLAIEWLARLVFHEDSKTISSHLAKTASAVEDYLSDWREHVEWMISETEGIKKIFLAGRGPSLAAAETGGLILKESTRFPAEGMSSAAFRHGPLEAAEQGSMVMVFEGDKRTASLNGSLVREVKLAGARGILIGPRGGGPTLLRVSGGCPVPILEILPVQMLTLALSARQGCEAGRFERATKVTATE